MTTENKNITDPYAIDHEQVKKDAERPTNGPKVNWHNLPEGDAMSTWRILPYTKKRTFLIKISKHWQVPGMKGSITCPRSFINPDTNKPYVCAICEKFFELYNSKEAGDQAFAKQTLRQGTAYYANAINVDKPEAGVGVLTMPYGVYKGLFDWLDVPKFREFSHPQRGFNILIKSTRVVGAKVPGNTNAEKREYTVMPDTPSVIDNMDWLNHLYDLETILGIPTYEFTKSCLAKLMTNDETAGQLEAGTPFYYKRLGNGDEESQTTESFVKPTAPPATLPTPTQTAAAPPKFVTAPIQTKVEEVNPNVPSTTLGGNGKPVCFGIAFDENNKTCLKCSEVDNCEVQVLKTKRAAKASSESVNPAVNSPASTEAEVRAMFESVLNK